MNIKFIMSGLVTTVTNLLLHSVAYWYIFNCLHPVHFQVPRDSDSQISYITSQHICSDKAIGMTRLCDHVFVFAPGSDHFTGTVNIRKIAALCGIDGFCPEGSTAVDIAYYALWLAEVERVDVRLTNNINTK